MGKNSPALFELIREAGVNQKPMPVARQTRTPGVPAEKITVGGGDGGGQAEADELPVVPRVEPKPRVLLAIPKEEPREAEKPVAGGQNRGPQHGGPSAEPVPAAAPIRGLKLPELKLNTTTVSLGAVGVLLVVLVLWATAYRMGQSKAERQAQKELEIAGVRDPLKGDPIPLNPGLIQPDPGSQAGSPPPNATPPRAPQPSKPVAGPVGPLADTRQVGLNYCTAASRMDKEAADRAAGFLRENGVPAIAVLEGGASGSNNPDSWKVVVLQGITAQEYRDRAAVRTKVEADLSRLGEIYRRDPKGRFDFGQCAWEKKKE